MNAPKSVVPSLNSQVPRVLVLLMSHTYGTPELDHSYEYHNILPAFERLPLETRQFDFAQEILDNGYWVANANLRRVIEDWQPHALFVGIYQEQIDVELMRWISQETSTVTIGWFSDDQWRFESHSRFWALALNWVVTTDPTSVAKYRAVDQVNVIVSQWAANELVYRPTGQGLEYDVSFIGACYGARKRVVEHLIRRGVSVEAWGQGWPNGRASQEQMVRVFSSSKVNLNLAAGSAASGGGFLAPVAPQVKGRVFEVPACGGLLLTDYAAGLEGFYKIGREIVVFDGKKDMLAKIRQLLGDEPLRESIARAGYARTLRDHTWVRRLEDIFNQVGLLTGVGSSPEGLSS